MNKDAPHLAFCRHNVPTVAGSHVTGGGLSLAQLDPDARPMKLLPSRMILPHSCEQTNAELQFHAKFGIHTKAPIFWTKYTFKYHTHTHYHEVVYNRGDILATAGFPNEILVSFLGDFWCQGCRRIIAAVRMVLQAFRIQSREAQCQTQGGIPPRAWVLHKVRDVFVTQGSRCRCESCFCC